MHIKRIYWIFERKWQYKPIKSPLKKEGKQKERGIDLKGSKVRSKATQSCNIGPIVHLT